MANYDFESDFYGTREATSELSSRPHSKPSQINGQAGFLSVALHLKIPIITSVRNVAINGNSSIAGAGAGASAAVSNHADVFKAKLDQDFANEADTDWFDASADRVVDLRYITKIIRTNVVASNAEHLASMVNEVRILASGTLRQRHNILRLFALSWQERSDHGHHWPQLLMQKAELGTLDSYIRSSPRNLQTKLMVSLDVLHGLDALHDDGVTHCDVKPQNTLIFADEQRSADPTLTSQARVAAVRAKLCDFGFSVIHSDYESTSTCRAGIGTYPWMAPEMEACTTVELEHLHSIDTYSFALTLASVPTNGRTPLIELDRQFLTSIKSAQSGDLTAAKQLENELNTHGDLTPLQMTYIANVLEGALATQPVNRQDLQTIYPFLTTLFSLTVAHSGYYIVDHDTSTP